MSEEIKDETPGEELNEVAENAPDSTEEEVNQAQPPKKSGKIKWIFIILGVILIISGLGIKYAPDQFSFLMKKKFNTPELKIDEDNLREEALSPFFIPPGPAEDTIRIDLTIIWDGLASVRFKKKELYLRNLMYEKFYNIAKRNQDLNDKTTDLEDEVSSMLRNSLGVQNLVVKIKEIRYF